MTASRGSIPVCSVMVEIVSMRRTLLFGGALFNSYHIISMPLSNNSFAWVGWSLALAFIALPSSTTKTHYFCVLLHLKNGYLSIHSHSLYISGLSSNNQELTLFYSNSAPLTQHIAILSCLLIQHNYNGNDL